MPALLPTWNGRARRRQPGASVKAAPAMGLRHLWWANGSKIRLPASGVDSLVDAAGNASGTFGAGTAALSGNGIVLADGDHAIYFDPAGTGQLISTQLKVGDSGGSGAPNVGSFSLFARLWVSAANVDTVVIYGGGSSSVGWRFNSSGQLEFLRTNNALLGTSSGTITAATWHSVGVSFDGTNGVFYIDGKNAGTFSSTSSFSHTSQHYLGAGASGEWVSNITMRMRYVAVADGARGAGMFKEIHDNPWPLFVPEPSTRIISLPIGPFVYARPTADNAAGLWVPS